MRQKNCVKLVNIARFACYGQLFHAQSGGNFMQVSAKSVIESPNSQEIVCKFAFFRRD